MSVNVQGVIQTAQTTGGIGNWQTPGYIRGEVRVMVAYFVGTGNEVTGSTIKMHPPLDAGAMILFHILNLSATATSMTISIGDLDSATRYTSAVATATAGDYGPYSLSGSTGPYIIGTNPATPTATDTDAQIILTIGGATLPTSAVLTLMTVYTID